MNFKKIFPYFIIAALVLWLLHDASCEGNAKKEKQEIPEISGNSKPLPVQPQTVITSPVQGVKSIGQNLSKNDLPKFDQSFFQNEIERLLLANDSIHAAFMVANDSMQAEMFKLQNALRTFTQKHSDSLVDITATGITQGELKSMQFFYTLKPRTVTVPPAKEIVFRLNAGLDIGNTAALDKFVIRANVGFQTRNTTYTAAMDSEQRIWFGIAKPILTIKK